MDELKLSFGSNFMRGIVAKILGKMIRKQLGCDVDILFNEIKVTAVDGKIHIHADIDAETTYEDFMTIVKNSDLI